MRFTQALLSCLLYSSQAVLVEGLPGASSAASSAASPPPSPSPSPTPTSTPDASTPTSSIPADVATAMFMEAMFPQLKNNWSFKNCSLPAATDSAMNPADRWAQVNAEEAWQYAVKYYNDHKDQGQFSQVVGEFFKYSETMFCADLADNNGCNSIQTQCDQFNSPAGYMIVTSLIWIDRQYLAIYQAITGGTQQVVSSVGDLLSTFAPLQKDTIDIGPILLDVISLTFSLAVSPMWNKIFRESKAIKSSTHDLSNELGTAKDWVNPLVTQSLTILKDSSKAGTQLANEETLDKTIATITNHWESGLNDTVTNLFSGSKDSNDLIYQTIKDGKFFNFDGVESQYGLEQFVGSALYAYLIPQAWGISDQGPFVLDTGYPCVAAMEQVPDEWAKEWFHGGKVNDDWICYNDKAYFLVGANKKNAQSCDWSGNGYCDVMGFYTLSGTSDMDGNNWGGLRPDDIINGTLNAYFNNGQKNGWSTGDASDQATLDSILDDGFSTPGIFTIPVCGADEAYKNWKGYSQGFEGKTEHWPCD